MKRRILVFQRCLSLLIQRLLPFFCRLVLGVVYLILLDTGMELGAAETFRKGLSPLQLRGNSGNGPSSSPVISQSGESVFFLSAADNLVTDDPNGSVVGLFRWDRVSGKIRSLSHSAASAGIRPYGVTSFAVSTDGQHVFFTASIAKGNEVDFIHRKQLFAWDFDSDRSRLVSGVAGSEMIIPSNGSIELLEMAPDGKSVLVASTSNDISVEDSAGNMNTDLLLYDVESGLWSAALQLFGERTSQALPRIHGSGVSVRIHGFSESRDGFLFQEQRGSAESNLYSPELESGNKSDLVWRDLESNQSQGIDFVQGADTPQSMKTLAVRLSEDRSVAIAMVSVERLSPSPFLIDLESLEMTKIPWPEGREGNRFWTYGEIFINPNGNVVIWNDGGASQGSLFFVWNKGDSESSELELPERHDGATWKLRGFLGSDSKLLIESDGGGQLATLHYETGAVDPLPWRGIELLTTSQSEVGLFAIVTRDPLLVDEDLNHDYDVYLIDVKDAEAEPVLVSRVSSQSRVSSIAGMLDQTWEVSSGGGDRSWVLMTGRESRWIPDGRSDSQGVILLESDVDGSTRVQRLSPPVIGAEKTGTHASFPAASSDGSQVVYLYWGKDFTVVGSPRTPLLTNELFLYSSNTEGIDRMVELMPLELSLDGLTRFSPPSISADGNWVVSYVELDQKVQLVVFDLQHKTAEVRVPSSTQLSDTLLDQRPIVNRDGSRVIIPPLFRRESGFIFDRVAKTFVDLASEAEVRQVNDASSSADPLLLGNVLFDDRSVSEDGHWLAALGGFGSPVFLVDLRVLSRPTARLVESVPLFNQNGSGPVVWDNEFPPVLSPDASIVILKVRGEAELHAIDLETNRSWSIGLQAGESVREPENYYGVQFLRAHQLVLFSVDGVREDGARSFFVRDLESGSITEVKGDTSKSRINRLIASSEGDQLAYHQINFDEAPPSVVRNEILVVVVPSGREAAGGDHDGDGMLDAWEENFFSSGDANPVSDDDGDGVSNLSEFIAGTHPLDPTSTLAIELVEIDESRMLRLCWSVIPGKQYIVEFRNELAGAWERSQGAIVVDGMKAEYVDIVPKGNDIRFFRVVVE